tara:strand:- start:94 stop:822 length:729 start_codon:yes stop_codon:yes gene_type:complete
MSILFGQSGYEIAKKLDEKDKPKNMMSKTYMVLTNSKGKKRNSVMLTKTMDDSKLQLIWFLEPKDDKGISFLKIEHDDRDDEMRIWLPAFKRVRRISARKKGDSFMGSDLSYEDMTSRSLVDNDYKRLEDETVNSRECFVIEVTPDVSLRSSYSKHKAWIVKDDIYIIKEESYDKRGKLKKEKIFSYINIDDYDILSKISVKDLQKKHKTDISFEQVKVDIEMNEEIFQEKSLKRLPLYNIN